jgi:exosome complex RNA-binding protein Csl4
MLHPYLHLHHTVAQEVLGQVVGVQEVLVLVEVVLLEEEGAALLVVHGK